MKKPINEIERLKLIAGLINEVEYNDSVYGVKRTTLTEGKKKKEVKELSIDVANPYEYRMGLQYELEQMDDYSNESLEKAKSIVLKNLAKDVNFYTTLLNQDQSPYKFEAPETDKPGMQARPDGFLKKELKKDEKANVQDTLGKKESGKKKPKGVKVMPDKGVEGKEKVVKEGLEENSDENYDIFMDGVLDVLVKDKLITKADVEALNSGGADELMDALQDEWKGFESYEETGQAISRSDLNLAARAIAKKLGKIQEDSKDPYDKAKVMKVKDKFEVYTTQDGKIKTFDTEAEAKKFADEHNKKNVKENVEEVLPGVNLGASFDKLKGEMNAEDEFNSLMSKYDWYYEMSDDPRAYDRGTAMNSKLKMLGKQIGVDKAVELFNTKAPSDRKITSSFFMEGEDKHSKIKEALKAALKKALKEEDPAMVKLDRDEEAAEKALANILKKKADILNKPGTQG